MARGAGSCPSPTPSSGRRKAGGRGTTADRQLATRPPSPTRRRPHRHTREPAVRRLGKRTIKTQFASAESAPSTSPRRRAAATPARRPIKGHGGGADRRLMTSAAPRCTRSEIIRAAARRGAPVDSGRSRKTQRSRPSFAEAWTWAPRRSVADQPALAADARTATNAQAHDPAARRRERRSGAAATSRVEHAEAYGHARR